jgi:aspartate kinase
MKVFKFGGASVKDATAVRNTANIIQSYSHAPLLVVVSAMGKTTNALERVVSAIVRKQNYKAEVQAIREYHQTIIQQLFSIAYPIVSMINQVFDSIDALALKEYEEDKLYDEVVSLGEIISTRIISEYLTTQDIKAQWLDARQFLFTDNSYREGKVDWLKTHHAISQLKLRNQPLLITQGFIGGSEEGLTTTLGREGSDFTAAIFASCLQAESVTIWKDVPGVMNADPKRFPDATVFEELPFKEAAEMTYYGASVIHPKTIKPLANAGIPLLVKNFDNPSLPGTRIHECRIDELPPLIVFKDNQCLISCKVTDYTFVNEEHLSIIFQAVSALDLKINLMQNSAISFSFCVDFRENKVLALIEKLQHHFEVYYNTGLTLMTVKNYDEKTFETYRKQSGVMLEQSSRSTLQVLVRN